MSVQAASSTSVPTTGGERKLRRELGLPQVFMQSLGTIAPAASLLFTIQLMAQYAGIATSLALVIGGAIMVMAAVALSDLARRVPSAAGYYAYVTESLGPRWGLGTAWMELIYMVAAALNAGFISEVIQSQLKANYSFNLPWQVLFVLIIVTTRFLVWRGVKLTGKALIILGSIELAVLLILGIWGFANPGHGGVQVGNAFSTSVPKGGDFALAVVFAIFFYAGWEGAGPVAEETENPRRNIPIAMIGSLLLLLVVFVISVWGTFVGWGTAHLDTFVSSSTLPNFVLVHQWWHGAWIILLLVLLNSVVCFALCGTLVATRMLYGMSRVGVMPAWLNSVDDKYGTPHRAIAAELVIALVVGLVMGQIFGPQEAFFIYGLAATLLYIGVYIVGNGAVLLFFRRKAPQDFNVIRHVVFPLVSAAGLIYVFYKTVNPFPAYPVGAGIWWALGWAIFGVGLALVVGNRARGKSLLPDGDDAGGDSAIIS
jgi:amino acid transporter